MLVVRYFCTQYLKQVRSFQRLFIHISALGYIVVNLLAGKNNIPDLCSWSGSL